MIMADLVYITDVLFRILHKFTDTRLPAALMPVMAAFFAFACVISAVKIVSKSR